MNPRLLAVLALPVILALATGLAIAFGGPSEPAPMASINNPFKGLDYSEMPASRQFLARDQTRLSFYADQFANAFAAQGKQGVVRLLPGIDHIQLTLDQAAVDAAVAAVGSMGKPGS